MFDEVRRIYDQSLKPRDRRSNVLFFRVLAAPLVLVAARLGLTPNQVTLAGLIPMAVGLYCWIEMPGSLGLWLGLLGIELAYILDCVDGQLARYTDQTSPVGAELDFMMDEIKALALVCRWAQDMPVVPFTWRSNSPRVAKPALHVGARDEVPVRAMLPMGGTEEKVQ